jgi:hypothetical protein
MTALVILLVLAAGVLVATARTLQHDRPAHLPGSHPEWGTSRLPSHPFSAEI